MTKAEERAFEAYPRTNQVQYYHREGFVLGYSQAEKDLSITIEDIEKIHTFLYAIKNNKQGAFTFKRLSDEQYNEVLRRLKEAKK